MYPVAHHFSDAEILQEADGAGEEGGEQEGCRQHALAACFPGAAIGEARFRPNHASAATPAHSQVHINGQKLVSGACVKKNKNGTTTARATASLNPAEKLQSRMQTLKRIQRNEPDWSGAFFIY